MCTDGGGETYGVKEVESGGNAMTDTIPCNPAVAVRPRGEN